MVGARACTMSASSCQHHRRARPRGGAGLCGASRRSRKDTRMRTTPCVTPRAGGRAPVSIHVTVGGRGQVMARIASSPSGCPLRSDVDRFVTCRYIGLRSSATPGEPSTSVSSAPAEEPSTSTSQEDSPERQRHDSDTASSSSAPEEDNDTLIRTLISVSVIVVAVACLVYSCTGHAAVQQTAREAGLSSSTAGAASAASSLLNGSWASFALIFLSEIGDKTFFIAALLSLTGSKLAVFSGAVAALAGMSAISVAIGSAIMAMPGILSNEASRRAGEIVSAVILMMFGMKNLSRYVNVGSVAHLFRGTKGAGGAGDSVDDERPMSLIDEEMEDARKVVMEASGDEEALCYAAVSPESGVSAPGAPEKDACDPQPGGSDVLKQLGKAASLIFLAEWGDRSMLATVALSTSHAPLGVFFGATAGHAVATGLAVIGGAIIGKYINEKVITVTSGVLFVVFGVTTALGVF